MFKSVALMVTGMSLAVPCAALADDAPPTLQERVGYADSLANSAAGGDKKALATLQSNAALNDAGAQYGLGEYYSIIKDYPESIAWFQKSTTQGFAGGYYALGIAYDLGQGLTQDYTKALQQYLKATDLSEAEVRIGLLYALGHGVKRDYSQADSWYRKAADAGSIEADIDLGDAYETGRGIRQDDVQASHWFRVAADVGDAQAQYALGYLYENSRSLQDYKQAAAWYQKASQQGVADAQLNLGLLYSSGKGVPADPAKAVQQFQMSANQRDGRAQYELAESFADGKGVPADSFRAYEWMILAKASLDEKDPTSAAVAERLKDLEAKLSPTQITRAKQAAAEWLKIHATVKHQGAV